MSSGRGGIDYSKWDRMNFSDDSDEDQPSQQAGASPRVTKLEGPSRVTCQSDGSVTVEPSSCSFSTPHPQAAASAASIATKKNDQNQQQTIQQDWTRNGGEVDSKLYWSQDRYNVVLRYALPPDIIVGQDVRVEVQGILPYEDRNCATSIDQTGSLSIFVKNIPILHGDLPHPCFLGQDDEDEVDWTVETVQDDTKYVVITLHKAVPMEGVTLWWSRPLQHLPERDVSNMEGRDQSQKQQQLQDVWEEAHKQFRENIQSREKHSIQLPSED